MGRMRRLNAVERLAVRILLLGEDRRPRRQGKSISRLLGISQAGISRIKSKPDFQKLKAAPPPELGRLTLRELGLQEDEHEVFDRFAQAAHAMIDKGEREYLARTGEAFSDV